jgi:hypothetical protein
MTFKEYQDKPKFYIERRNCTKLVVHDEFDYRPLDSIKTTRITPEFLHRYKMSVAEFTDVQAELQKMVNASVAARLEYEAIKAVERMGYTVTKDES